MNLLCPNCQKAIQVSEQYAGQEVRCPLCNGTFTVPVVPDYHATPVTVASPQGGGPPPAPSASVPPDTDVYTLAPPQPPSPSPWQREEPKRAEEPKPRKEPPAPLFPDSVALPQLTPGYQHLYSIWISPRVVKWVPLAALVLVFFGMFSVWVVFVGKADESVTGWQTGFGARSNFAGTLYELLFVAALLAAIAAAVLPRVPRDRLHPSIPQILPWSSAVVGGAAFGAFVFLLLSFGSGYGGEGGAEMSTGWLRFSVVCLIVAVGGAALDLWITLRGPTQPLPRIDVTW